MNERDNEVSAQSVDSLLNYETVKTFTNEGFERDRLDRTLALYQALRSARRPRSPRSISARPGSSRSGSR